MNPGKQMNLREKLAKNLNAVDTSNIHSKLQDTRRETELDWAYRMSAAVLSQFNPSMLRPYGIPSISEQDRRSYIARLLRDCSHFERQGGVTLWALKHPNRKATLTRLKTRQAMRDALALYDEKPTDLLQKILKAYINGSAKPLSDQSLQELHYSFQVVSWLSDTDLASTLPDLAEISQAIDWWQLLEPFHYLVGNHFRGRVGELAQLNTYVFDDAHQSDPPLLLYGAGGLGKSTLLSKFILEHTTDVSTLEQIPFVYINFDRPVATPEEPVTLLIEAARQLAIQYPQIGDRSRIFEEEWLYNLRVNDTRSEQQFYSDDVFESAFEFGESTDVRSSLGISTGYIDDFYFDLLTNTEAKDKPFLMILDTFEEVQLRSRDQVQHLSLFFEELRNMIPQTRLVISGRGLIEENEMEVLPMELKAFDEAASVGYLTFKGIENEAFAREVYRLVGGNPLSLKLAMDLIEREQLKLGQSEGIAQLRQILLKVEEGNIQGVLYRRILDHILDDDVRRLAHPGLALRVVTADLIQNVLAEPCGLGQLDKSSAAQLFAKLQKEVSLVTPDPKHPNTLRHRPDVRAVMLHALQFDEPLIVHEIHKRAVKYYAKLDTAEARAEEIYHRLFADRDFVEVDNRWDSRWENQLAQALRPALEELPEPAQAWLAGRLGITGFEIDWDEADLVDWERVTAKRVDDMLFNSRFDEAYQLLLERRERSVGSRLFYYETLVLIQKKLWEEARRCVKDGLYSMRQAKDEVRLLALLKLATRIDLELGYYDQAKALLEQTRPLLFHDADPAMAELELGLQELQITRALPGASNDEIEAIRSRLLAQFKKVSDRQLRTNPRVVRQMAAEFSSEDNEVLKRSLSIMTLGDLSDERKQEIGQALAQWDEAFSTVLDQKPGVLLRFITGQDYADRLNLSQAWADYTNNVRASQLTSDIERLLKQYGDQSLSVDEIKSSLDVQADQDVEFGGVNISDISGGSVNFGTIISGSVGGDIVAGDKVGGDKIGGDKIIYGSPADPSSLAELQTALTDWQRKIETTVDALSDLDDDEKGDIKKTSERITREALKGQQASVRKMERWLNMMSTMAPDILDVTAATLQNPFKGVGLVLQKINDRIKLERS